MPNRNTAPPAQVTPSAAVAHRRARSPRVAGRYVSAENLADPKTRQANEATANTSSIEPMTSVATQSGIR